MENRRTVSPFISKAEIARRRGVSRLAVYRAIWAGLIPTDAHGRIGRDAFERLQAQISLPADNAS